MTNALFTQHLAPEQALALQLLAHRFRDVPIWFGEATRHWWALVADRFVEADTPEELSRMLDSLHASQRSRPVDGCTAHAPSPGTGPYGPPLMAAAARPTPSPAPSKATPRAATPSPHRRHRPGRWPRRHRIGSWLPAPAA